MQIVRDRYEAFVAGDLEGVLKGCDLDIVSYTAPPFADAAEYQGHEGLLRWMGNWTEGFDQFEMEVEEYMDAGDHVVVRAFQRATGAISGAPVEARFWFVNTVRDGKIVRMGAYPDESEALEAAGLSR